MVSWHDTSLAGDNEMIFMAKYINWTSEKVIPKALLITVILEYEFPICFGGHFLL